MLLGEQRGGWGVGRGCGTEIRTRRRCSPVRRRKQTTKIRQRPTTPAACLLHHATGGSAINATICTEHRTPRATNQNPKYAPSLQKHATAVQSCRSTEKHGRRQIDNLQRGRGRRFGTAATYINAISIQHGRSERPLHHYATRQQSTL